MTERLKCTGCGCELSIEELRRQYPRALSCCPERDMQPEPAVGGERAPKQEG